MKYNVVDTNYNINDLVGIVGDQTIHLAGYISEKKYPEDFRLVKFYDAEKDEISHSLPTIWNLNHSS